MIVHRRSGHANIWDLRVYIPEVCVDLVAQGLQRKDVLAACREYIQKKKFQNIDHCIFRTHRAHSNWLYIRLDQVCTGINGHVLPYSRKGNEQYSAALNTHGYLCMGKAHVSVTSISVHELRSSAWNVAFWC